MVSDIIDARDKGYYSTVVMLDYSQAFDSISHDMLLAKLHFLGFGERARVWIKSYLNSRLQVTKLGSETSEPLSKPRGVPQGSCFGPVLFNLYTVDFSSCVQHCTAHMYVDDFQLHLSYKPGAAASAIDLINKDLKNIAKWSKCNGLRLNVSKCSVLHIAPPDLMQTLSDRGVIVTLNGENLSVCDKVKTLGVVLDRGLSFTDHVSSTIQRAMGRLRGLHRVKDMLPEPAKIKLIQSMVLSVFYYCFPVYGNSISREDMARIQKLQNCATRFIFNLRTSEHVTPYRDAANMLPMEVVCRMLTCSMVHKVLTLKEPQYLCEKLAHRGDVSERRTRHAGRLHFPKVELEIGRKSFSYFAPKLYNDLPDNLKACNNIVTFKKRFRNMLL